MRQLISHIPVLRSLALRIRRKWIARSASFVNSEKYWIERYAVGGNSGDGSRNCLATFKANTVNSFVVESDVSSVIEFGCGDGSQLALARYPRYVGYDVSPKAIELCRQAFVGDDTKIFKLLSEYGGEKADLTLSLDVIYHLTEDSVFSTYMSRLFQASEQFVVIYSSDIDTQSDYQPAHVKHRRFSKWVSEAQPEWQLIRRIPNAYPFQGDTATGSFADFFIYQRLR